MAMVDRSLWQRIIQEVIAEGGNIIRPWFTELEPICLEHGLLEIQVPGRRELEYCRRHAQQLFTEAAQGATGRLVGVCFLTSAQAESPADAGEAPDDELAVDEETPSLSEDYRFDAFVTGPANRLAHAACQAISETPGHSYNPLFLYGSVGLGKTHLLHATCRRISENNRAARISLLTCETFVNDFIDAVAQGELHQFRYRYRHADVLAIDDIQFLANHEQTQEEFFHTFNTLYQAHKQIVLSSDRGPAEIPDLEERLVSRFNWGLVARIDRPCYETRVAILRRKARARGLDFPENVLCYLAGTIDSNARDLEGAIAKVQMLAQVTDRPINLALAQEALGGEPDPRRREITVEDILKAVTARFNVRLADLQSKKRNRSIAFPRQVCMFLARALTRHSLEEIGGYFGGRDHTTVLHADRTIRALREEDAHLDATLDRLAQEIQTKA
ncbi:MAG: chromosomal replication initiator protein DnaA [Phycisphaerae bacterium]